jgi:hypothetical protein
MAFAAFGPGIIILTRTDLPAQTPINVGFAQELSLDFAGESKELFGQNQFAEVIARGTIKASGKMKAAEISGIAWNSVFFGMSGFAAGGFAWNPAEQHTISAGGLITVTNSALFDQDLGVLYDATAQPFQKGSVAPSAGHYSVGAGVYAFNTAEAGTTVDITYTSSTTVGQSLTVTSQPIGTTPNFQLDYWTNLNQPGSTPFAVRIFACVASKLSIAGKLTDFIMPEFDFGIYALPNKNVFTGVFPQVS